MKTLINFLTNSLLVALLCLIAGCSDDDNSSDSNGSNYIRFKYNNTEYNILGDVGNPTQDALVFFHKEGGAYTLAATKLNPMVQLAISVSGTIEEGKTYPIYTSSPLAPSNITVLFATLTTADQSKLGRENLKIGELHFSKLTSESMAGTFFCEMENGNITNGEFVLKRKLDGV